MRSVLETCLPRQSILKGTFNPEVFTAALGPVVQYYKGHNSSIDRVYTDAKAFFTEATYPTSGLRQTVNSVFKRIAGDPGVPSIQRMETAFGGGKTHTLIACVHIAYKGKEIADAVADIINPAYLPDPGTVIVAGIAGDEIPVTKTKGDSLVPYTLWGELAYQIGGEHLYREVKDEAESFASPGKHFLEKVLSGKKVLIMLDELAQYAARLEVAVPGQGADQLAAFIMALNGYAKTHDGIAIVVTLAGTTDAFSKQTKTLTEILNQIGDGDLNQDDASSIAEKAQKGISSVVSRDATVVTPVQANEISAVLAKRLFEQIDSSAAQEAMEDYTEVYRKNASMLPEEATSMRFRDRILANYPFHPTLIDFLNNKLAQAENFQGTRGVLRTLAMTVRCIWDNKSAVQMIHVSDIDMRNVSIVDELLGRTSSADLRQVLNADVGSVETSNLQGGLSNAQRADQRNPHPDGIPFYELTWKAVFLNSLVGRNEGKNAPIFGISQQDAIFQVATPLLAPSQVRTALDEISDSAFYLRFEDGKYFAHMDPTINSVLARIRQTITEKQISQKLKSVSSGLVKDNDVFRIEHGVKLPQDIPDGKDAPTIAVISLDANEIKPDQFITTKGDGIPRSRQNMVLLLVPKSVNVINDGEHVSNLFGKSTNEAKARIEDIARQVIAIKTLEDSPQAYGIAPSKLKDPEFIEKQRERNFALDATVSELYTDLYYPTANGVEKKTLKSATGEGGATILSQVQQVLTDAGKLVYTTGRLGTTNLKSLANGYFFLNDDKAACNEILDHFFCRRTWPILAKVSMMEMILREGVESGIWVAYKMSEDPTDSIPGELWTQEKAIPMSVDPMQERYSIMTLAGAKKRNWIGGQAVPNEKVKKVIKDVMQTSKALSFSDVANAVTSNLANVSEQQIKENVQDVVQSGGYAIYSGEVHQVEKPDHLVEGFTVATYDPKPDDVLITKAEQSERGWFGGYGGGGAINSIHLEGNDGAKKLLPLLRRLGSLYVRGATSTIDELDIADLQLPSGGTLRISLDHAAPSDIKALDEFFQTVADVVKLTDNTDGSITINDPDDSCTLVKELRKQ